MKRIATLVPLFLALLALAPAAASGATSAQHLAAQRSIAAFHCHAQVFVPGQPGGPCVTYAVEWHYTPAAWGGMLSEARIMWRLDRSHIDPTRRYFTCRRYIMTIDGDANGSIEDWVQTQRDFPNDATNPGQITCNPIG